MSCRSAFARLLCVVVCLSLGLQAAQAGGRRKGARAKGARVKVRRVAVPPPPRRAQAVEGPEFGEDVEGRAAWFMFKREFPSGAVAAGARRRAWESSRTSKLKDWTGVRAEAERLVWMPIGPRPTAPPPTPKNWGGTSGRVNAVAVSPADPRVVLLGSATGGIWRSADGGATFAPVSDNQADLPVGWIAFAPSSPATVYAGMGDIDYAYLGSGVLKSTDAGQTWMRVSNSTLPDGVTARLEVDPSSPQRVYLAQYLTKDKATDVSSASGLFVSDDGGVNWTKKLAGQARDLAIHPTDPRVLYATFAARTTVSGAAGVAPGLYRSNDAGETWARVALPPDLFRGSIYDFRVAVTPADPQRVYVYSGTIFSNERRLQVSRDGGATWEALSLAQVDTGQFGYNTYLFVDPRDADLVYLGSRDLWKSLDGGASWSNVTKNFVPAAGGGWSYQPSLSSLHPDQQAFAFEPGNPSVVYLGNDGGLWKSSDGGATVQSLNATLSLTQFNSLALHPTDNGITAGGTQDNGTQRRLKDASLKPTAAWSDFAGSDGGACFFSATNPAVFYGTWFSAWVNRFRASDSGFFFDKTVGTFSTWGESESNTRIAFYPPLTGNGVNGRVYFGSWRLFVSDNQGDTWFAPGGLQDLTKGDRDVLTAIGVGRSNTSFIYTGSAQGRAMMSRNGGASWTDITAGLPERFIESVVVDPSDPSVAYLAVSGFGTGHVFKTTDAGASWVDVSGDLPNVPTNALLVDPSNRAVVYAGTDIGVFRSTSGGGTWEPFNDGLPPVPVTAFAARAGGPLQVATYGRGAYELTTVQVGPSSVGFASAASSVAEGAGSVRLTVTRAGDLSVPARVDYATSDGTASARDDYTAAYGTLRFAAGEATKTLEVFVTDDRFAEAPETFNVTLSDPVNTSLGAAPATVVTVTSDDAAAGPNPVAWDSGFDTAFFVRQHYVDFFNREPDAPGLAFWTGVIESCGADALCREVRRINVSAAFFLSIEFQETGYLAYLTHQAAFGTAERLRLRAFLADLRELGRGVIVNQGEWKAQLEANKAAFFEEFVARAPFAARYAALSNAQYVEALAANTGGSLTPAERDALVKQLDAKTLTRAAALRRIAEHPEFARRHYNRAFVLMQYFGYLRRNPDEAPEPNLDFAGYNFWLSNLDKFGGNFVQAELVKAFITSAEYKQRFGP